MNDRLEIASRILSSVFANGLNPETTPLQRVKSALEHADLLIGEERNRSVASFDSQGIDTMANVERAAIVRTLRAVKWNREDAARVLQIGERTLYRKLQEYRISESAESNNAVIGGMK